jgi:hypothetical protein
MFGHDIVAPAPRRVQGWRRAPNIDSKVATLKPASTDAWIGKTMLIFCHCPKTAGTSLFRAISTIHGPQHSYLAKRERPDLSALRARGVTFIGGHVPYEHYAGQADAMRRARTGYNLLHSCATLRS